jgi:SAM-dependent methyltransferase
MSDSVLDFYEHLSETYHLIWKDWTADVKWQGNVLDSIIRKATNKQPQQLRVHDCSCGIGTQSIGLALRGYRVHATDLSPTSVERAQKNAADLGARLTFGVADFRYLQRTVQQTFDVVLSCDNSLPHLLTQAELEMAAGSIHQVLDPGGVFIASIRDYDQMKRARPPGRPPRKLRDSDGERIYFQTWEWSSDGTTYELEFFILRNNGTGWLPPISSKTRYRAVQRRELSEALGMAGFEQIEWLLGEHNPYYQPLVIARKSPSLGS